MKFLPSTGAARAQLARLRPNAIHPTPSALDAFVERLARAVPSGDLDAVVLSLAADMAAWPAALESDARRALCLLIVVSLDHVRNGSTYLPLLDLEGQGEFLLRCQELLRAGYDAEDAEAVALEARAEINALLDQGRQGPLRDLVGAPGDYTPFILDDTRFYHQRLWVQEVRLAKALATRKGQTPDVDTEALRAAFDHVYNVAPRVDGRAMPLSPEQEHALLTVAHHTLTVISGGPGTGKTSIVISVLRLMVRLGLPPDTIALAAPTGKAARRMQASIQSQLTRLPANDPEARRLRSSLPAPCTLHRLLGYRPDLQAFRFDDLQPLPHALIIIDEASMVDLAMMDQLVRAVRPSARLVLLGDAEQLPSVDAGAVLRDLVPATSHGQVPWRDWLHGDLPDVAERQAPAHPLQAQAVCLTRSFRMDLRDPDGRHILMVAQAMLAGQGHRVLASSGDAALRHRDHPDALTFHGVEGVLKTPSPLLLEHFLAVWFQRQTWSHKDLNALATRTYTLVDGAFVGDDQIALDTLMTHWAQQRVLGLTRHGWLGVDAINASLHQQLCEQLAVSSVAPWAPGEPLMMRDNDYNKGLFNGDMGVVLNVCDGAHPNEPPALRLVFPEGERARVFHPESLQGQVRWAFAMTVHKSQGSEFMHVAVVLPDRDGPLLTRELLYTALTRSRRAVSVLGDARLLAVGIQRRVRRACGIAARLRYHMDDPGR